MATPWLKICGLTRAEDARLSLSLGARYLGCVLVPASPRCVTVPQAQALSAVAEGRLVVVVRDLPAAKLEELLAAVHPAAVQLHGEEPPELVHTLRTAHPEVEVWKVLAVAPAAEHVLLSTPDPAAETERLLALARPYEAAGVAAFLVDTQGPGGSGGTGQTGDWAVAAELARRLERPLILAGGLTPENLADAAAQVQPAGLDVSSGVEASPGCKSPARLQALFRALRA